ncbi:MAG: hypothetical protein REI11_04135, partial [Patulibacter sp.]|nr:hypothetical protein [Patulibacter sp.]
PSPTLINALAPITASDIQAKVPTKLFRAVQRAHGVAPGEMLLQHATDAQWIVTWPGLPNRLTATADGHTITAG